LGQVYQIRGSPTVRQRELGIELRDLRTKRDLTLEQVAEQLECSTVKISRIETVAWGTSRRTGIRDR
jgi:hypothetical protein